MLKKNKKFTLLLSGLSGALLVSSAAGVALSSCSTTSSSSSSSDVQYSYVIDWNNEDAVKRLNIDDNGLVYSDSAMTTLIAVSPKVKLTTVKIPSRVKSIMGYSKVMYKDASGNLYDQIPSTGTASSYTKVYQPYGAFQGMESLETVVLESGSQLQSIGGKAFYGCITLKNITNLSSSLNYVGSYAFYGCTSLSSIDLSNVVKVDDYAFAGCTSLPTIDLTNTLSIGNYAFQNCSSLTALGSLEKATSIGEAAFSGATKSGSNISLKFSSLKLMSKAVFYSAQGITTVDFSNNTLLTSITDNAFMYSSVTTVNFDGCSSLTTIGERIFEGCTSLTSVTLPSDDITSLTTIGYNAFINCKSLTTVGAKGTTAKSFVATKKLSTVGANFLANTLIETVNLSNFVISSTNVSSNPFGSAASLAYIPNLTTVTLPSNIATLNAGLFYGSGLSSSTGFSLKLPSTITSLGYNASLEIASPNNTDTTKKEKIPNATPFTNSGLASIDMSDITSYQTTEDKITTIPDYLFNGATKLTSVVLKTDTTAIGTYAFAGTTALTSITYPSSSDTATAADATTNGFAPTSVLTTIGENAFANSFSADLTSATLDLSQMTFSSNTTPKAFSGSNFTELKLPTTTTIIAANSFDNMTKLATVNFGELTKLTTIWKTNFNNTQLKSIDLSGVTNATSLFSGENSAKLFTGLPSDCVVALPSTIGNFSGVFTDTNNSYVTFKYPNGISASLFTINSTTGVLAFNSSTNINKLLITNASELNLTNLSNVKSIGTNTFFGNEKLTTLTLPAAGISTTTTAGTGIFNTGSSITANASNTASTSSYVTANIPFGSNEAFKTLNYTAFTSSSNVVATDDAADNNAAQTTLFAAVSDTAWKEVVTIINSLSYQAHPTSKDTAEKLKANMSSWAAESADASGNAINNDAVSTLDTASSPKKVTLTNSFTPATRDAANSFVIEASATTAKFIHNNITWTYTNDGSTITLTGQANMYKVTKDASKSYLVFFNETTYSVTGGSTYYVPSQTPVNVTLTIATKASTK